MERDEGARLVGWTVGPGCLAGVVAAVVVVAGLSGVDDDVWGPFWATAGIASFYGVFIGAVAGFVIGLPVALVVSVVRRHTDHWRGAGAALAGAFTIVAGLVPIGLQAAVAVGVLAAAHAWWGLGHVFDPPPVPHWLRTPSAHREE